MRKYQLIVRREVVDQIKTLGGFHKALRVFKKNNPKYSKEITLDNIWQLKK